MQYTSLLDEHMEPVLNSIIGKGSFSSKSIGLINRGHLQKLEML